MKTLFATSIIFLLTLSSVMAQNLNTTLRSRADSAFNYCRAHQLDTTFCILIDMGMHSGKNRLFVWDFKQHKVVRAGLCCHGIGRGSTPDVPVFSNQSGSYCTSLGKYKTGKRAYSNYGLHIHYKLHGLEETNSNAFDRLIVLHSHTPMPYKEIYPQHLPLGYSLGCPVVSDSVMRDLDQRLQKAGHPVLLWIFVFPPL